MNATIISDKNESSFLREVGWLAVVVFFTFPLKVKVNILPK